MNTSPVVVIDGASPSFTAAAATSTLGSTAPTIARLLSLSLRPPSSCLELAPPRLFPHVRRSPANASAVNKATKSIGSHPFFENQNPPIVASCRNALECFNAAARLLYSTAMCLALAFSWIQNSLSISARSAAAFAIRSRRCHSVSVACARWYRSANPLAYSSNPPHVVCRAPVRTPAPPSTPRSHARVASYALRLFGSRRTS